MKYFLPCICLLALLSCGRAPEALVEKKSHDIQPQLAEKGAFEVAAILGRGILKLRDQDFVDAISPIKIPARLVEASKQSTNFTELRRVARSVDEIECVGFKMPSTYMLDLVYVLPTDDGPWGLKLSIYARGQPHLFGFAVARSWESLEEMVKTVTPLEPKYKISRAEATRTEAVGATNRSQAVRSETNRMPGSADSRR